MENWLRLDSGGYGHVRPHPTVKQDRRNFALFAHRQVSWPNPGLISGMRPGPALISRVPPRHVSRPCKGPIPCVSPIPSSVASVTVPHRGDSGWICTLGHVLTVRYSCDS